MNILQGKIERYFKKMRHDQSHHLGLGDIRLTIAQQDEIVEMAKGGEGVSSECNTLLASREVRGEGGTKNWEAVARKLALFLTEYSDSCPLDRGWNGVDEGQCGKICSQKLQDSGECWIKYIDGVESF